MAGCVLLSDDPDSVGCSSLTFCPLPAIELKWMDLRTVERPKRIQRYLASQVIDDYHGFADETRTSSDYDIVVPFDCGHTSVIRISRLKRCRIGGWVRVEVLGGTIAHSGDSS